MHPESFLSIRPARSDSTVMFLSQKDTLASNLSYSIHHGVKYMSSAHIGNRWETPLRGEAKPLESRDACGSKIISIEPCHHARQMKRRGNPKMLLCWLLGTSVRRKRRILRTDV